MNESESADKTFLTPSQSKTITATAAVSTTQKSFGTSVASLTSAAKGGIMNWWYGSSSTANTMDNSIDMVDNCDGDNDMVLVQNNLRKKSFSFYVIGNREVVLYCCACFINTMPGYMYLTPSLLCLTARIPG